jgi:hypothetical protein
MALPRRAPDELSTAWVASTYGGLVPAKDLSRLLGFPSPAALRRAHATGRLAIPLFRLQGRRGWFAHAGDVSAYMRAQGQVPQPEEQPS